MKLPITNITIDSRIRIDFSKVDNIAESMLRLGQIAPVIVERIEATYSDAVDFKLIDGGQRIKAAEKIGWTEIECCLINDLNPLKRIEVEFEANEKRSGFTWQERCLTYRKLHKAKGFADPKWSIRKLQDVVGKSFGHVVEALTVADALERTKEQKDDWERGLWSCENFYAATQYLAMVNENLAFKEIERRKIIVREKLGLQKPAPSKDQNLIITAEPEQPKEQKPFRVELFNRITEPHECESALVFNSYHQKNDEIIETGATILWLNRLVDWLTLKEFYSTNGMRVLSFPLIWNTVRGKVIQDTPFYLNYKLGLFIPMPDYRFIEPLPSVITCPTIENSTKLPLPLIQYSLDAISREGDKIWLPYGQSVVEVAQCGRIPVWPKQETDETLEELKSFYIEQHGNCEFVCT